MAEISKAARSLWAKKSTDGRLFWLPLATHLADSAAVAQKLWNAWLPDGAKQAIANGLNGEDCAEQLFVFLAAAHDIGKATPVFQAKQARPPCSEMDGRMEDKIQLNGLPMRAYEEFPYASKTPHALATQLLLINAGCNYNVAVILGSHHGKPPDLDAVNRCGISTFSTNYHLGNLGREAWSAVQHEFIHYALELAGFASIEEIPSPNMAAQALLSALVIMTDWIASNEEFFPYLRLEDPAKSLDSKLRIRAAWRKLNLPAPWHAGNAWMRVNLCDERFGFTPNEIQNAVMQNAKSIREPGILILEAPMGTGKTEAALVAAEIFADKAQRTGVFFALPTQATTDAIFTRIKNWVTCLEDDISHSINLAHGKAQFNEDFQALRFYERHTHAAAYEEDEVFAHEWFKGKKKSMLADFVVGTIDQLLLAALKQKHVMLRHLGLANKVVIIDECHAYDAYMSRYLDMALRWLGAYRVPVIILSATLPALKRQMLVDAYLNRNPALDRLAPRDDPLGRRKNTPPQASAVTTCRSYPLITCTEGNQVKLEAIAVDGASRLVHLENLADDALADKLDDLLSGDGCAGVIVNTVGRAQKLAHELRKRFGEETVRLLHSRFLTPDRFSKERELLKELGKPGPDNIRPQRRIVIGTQVLEQSLDIDFDVLITDLCPMDLLLQRIGRLHRHSRERLDKLRMTQCYVLGLDGEDFDAGTKEIYGAYLLMRTKAFLPRQITLPQDIPSLVQDVYDENCKLPAEPNDYQEAKTKWEKQIADKEKRAEDFRISRPWPEPETNLTGWLETDVPASEKHSEAAVRDSDESIEVLLIQETKRGQLRFLPWQEGARGLSPHEIPDDELAIRLARQSVRLPLAFCTPWRIEQTIGELERLNMERLSLWQQSQWLKGELFLILDEACSASLCGFRVTYDINDGLFYEKEVKKDG